jgi:hypothetical protein
VVNDSRDKIGSLLLIGGTLLQRAAMTLSIRGTMFQMFSSLKHTIIAHSLISLHAAKTKSAKLDVVELT